ncbi:MAG: UbiA family prenyltransferase [bacterium]|nr:UbiA family prenyltransferase [bacterium]
MIPALLEACRPLNVLMAVLAVLVGALLAQADALAHGAAWLAAGGTALALAAGNLWNDLADLAEDRINRPGRPLPSGRLSMGAARRAAAGASLGALALALAIAWEALLLVAACLALLGWYARQGKQAGLAGNMAVASLAAASVGFGALSQVWAGLGARPEAALVPALLAGLLHLARELAKDAEDVAGDRQAGRRTWVLAAGPVALQRLLAQVAVLALLPPLLALLLGPPDPVLRAAHLIALAVAPLLLRQVLRGGLAKRDRAARLSAFCKQLLVAGLLVYAVAAILR